MKVETNLAGDEGDEDELCWLNWNDVDAVADADDGDGDGQHGHRRSAVWHRRRRAGEVSPLEWHSWWPVALPGPAFEEGTSCYLDQEILQ